MVWVFKRAWLLYVDPVIEWYAAGLVLDASRRVEDLVSLTWNALTWFYILRPVCAPIAYGFWDCTRIVKIVACFWI